MRQAANMVFPERGATTRIHPLAGKPPPASLLIDPSKLCTEYYARHLDEADPSQYVHFGTSGHRGSSLRSSRPPPKALLGGCRAWAWRVDETS